MPERNVTDHPPVRNDGSDDRRTRLRKKSPVRQRRNAYGTRWLLSLLFIIYYIYFYLSVYVAQTCVQFFFHPPVDSRGNANFSCPRVRVQSHTFAAVLINIIIMTIVVVVVIIVSSSLVHPSTMYISYYMTLCGLTDAGCRWRNLTNTLVLQCINFNILHTAALLLLSVSRFYTSCYCFSFFQNSVVVSTLFSYN